MAKSKPKTEFKLNQKIVYPSQGVGVIKEITEEKFDKDSDEVIWYYNIYIEVSDMTVMVPVDNAKEIGIRSIVGPEDAKKAINMLAEDFEPITSDWKLRYQTNLELLKKGSIIDIATIVRCLYNRSKVKELPIQERKLYDSARKLLLDEVCIALGISEKEAEAMIHEKLDPPGATPKIKHPLIQDDDDDDDFDMNDDDRDSSKDSDDDDDDDEDDDDDDGKDDFDDDGDDDDF